MFSLPTLTFVCSILSLSQASPAGQYSRRQDVCPATVTVTAAGSTSQEATTTSFVTLNPTTITVISSACNWTAMSLFTIVPFSTSSSGSPLSWSSTYSEAASSTSSPSRQSSLAVVSSSSLISSAAVNSDNTTFSAVQSSSTPSSKLAPAPSLSLLSAVASSSVSSTSSKINPAAVASSFLSTITNGPTISSITLPKTIIDDVNITSMVSVDDYTTSTIDVNVHSTTYDVASACLAVSTIANPDFNTPLPNNSWAEDSSPTAGYDISTDTDYYYNAPDSMQFLFAAGSTMADILSISQVVTVCPDQIYEFNVYATQDFSNTGYCKAWITTASQNGATEVGDAMFLGYGNDPVDDWSEIDISFNNAATNSYQLVLAISAYCVSGDPSFVYLDTVSVNVE